MHNVTFTEDFMVFFEEWKSAAEAWQRKGKTHHYADEKRLKPLRKETRSKRRRNGKNLARY